MRLIREFLALWLLKWYARTQLGIYGQIYPFVFRSSLGLCPRELLQAKGVYLTVYPSSCPNTDSNKNKYSICIVVFYSFLGKIDQINIRTKKNGITTLAKLLVICTVFRNSGWGKKFVRSFKLLSSLVIVLDCRFLKPWIKWYFQMVPCSDRCKTYNSC